MVSEYHKLSQDFEIFCGCLLSFVIWVNSVLITRIRYFFCFWFYLEKIQHTSTSLPKTFVF